MPITNPNKASRISESTLSDILRNERIQDFGFTSLTGTELDDLNPVPPQHQMRDANFMWLKNPLANSIIELQLDFALGDGITYAADDTRIQELLDDYWFDSDNDWENKGIDRFRDLSINGELLLKPVVKEQTGRVKLHSIYPERISQVTRDETFDHIDSVLLRTDDKELKILKKDDDGNFEGDVFLYQANKPTFFTRGVSDLFVIRDWLRLYDKNLYATMERIGLLLSFVWDITIKGGTAPQLREKFTQILKNPPRPGSFRVHNENETWDEKTPSLGGREFEDVFRLLKSQVIGGSRQPEHFFGMGGDVNLATARAMSEPYFKKIKRRQKFMRKILRDQFDHVIWAAKAANTIPENTNETYKINIPDPDKNVAQAIAETVLKFSNSLAILESNGYIDKKTATATISMILSQMGVDATAETGNQESIYDAISKLSKLNKK